MTPKTFEVAAVSQAGDAQDPTGQGSGWTPRERLRSLGMTGASILCVLAMVLAVRWFWRATTLLDQRVPASREAAELHVFLILLTLAAGGLAIWLIPNWEKQYLALAGLVAAPVALIGGFLGTFYNPDMGLMFILGIGLSVLLVAAIPTLIVLALVLVVLALIGLTKGLERFLSPSAPKHEVFARNERWLSISFVGAWGIALGHALASLYILMTFPDQIDAAREANRPTPGLGPMLVTTVVLATSVLRRRARQRAQASDRQRPATSQSEAS